MSNAILTSNTAGFNVADLSHLTRGYRDVNLLCVCVFISVFVNWQKAIEMPTIITISYHVHSHARIPIRWR